jgi:hypothetical protein
MIINQNGREGGRDEEKEGTISSGTMRVDKRIKENDGYYIPESVFINPGIYSNESIPPALCSLAGRIWNF